MNTEQAYDQWASQYDSNLNKTRDLEGVVLRKTLQNIHFKDCLEIGCGTGKNTAWLAERAERVTCVDLSAEMLAAAKEKIGATNVEFIRADITEPWSFTNKRFDLASFSLILEHIEDLAPILHKTAEVLLKNGHVYIGELHPFKQYAGSKARFETATGTQVVPCFNHHISDFTGIAGKYGLQLKEIEEYFDDNDRTGIPRILGMLFQKK